MENERRVAILGAAGAIGRAAMDEFERRSIPVVVAGRDATKLRAAFGGRAEIRPADLSSVAQTAEALRGTRTVLYAAGVPYPQFERHPVLMRNALEAARRAGVSRLLAVSSVYSYGLPREARVSEEHPREPETRKGLYRKQQEDAAMQADGEGGLRTAVLHLPDFYGPYAENSLAMMVVQWASRGQMVNWLGDLDAAHEFVFLPDAARVIADLLAQEDSFGRRWNLGGPGTITARAFISRVHEEFGRPVRARAAGKGVLRLMGLFNPLMRELVEMYYLGVTPVVLDDSRLSRHLGGLVKTPYPEGIRSMVGWFRDRSAAAAGRR